MPGVAGLLATSNTEDPIQPETTPLYLPSAMPLHIVISSGLTEIETKLRLAQADDALGELRRLLRILRGLLDYKYTQLGPSQRAGTRARSMVSRFKEKIDRCAESYQAAWNALTKLNPEGAWSQRLQRLTSAHIRTLGRGLDDESEGRREVHEDVKEGLGAYAAKQAGTMDTLARRFASEWHPILTKENQQINWPEEYMYSSSGGKGKERG